MAFKSRRTINDKSSPAIRIAGRLLPVLVILLLAGLAWESLQSLLKKGPAILAGRLSDATHRHVAIGSMGISFPNRIRIYQIAITENNGKPLFSCERLETFVGWQVLTGRLHIYRLDLFSPSFQIMRPVAGDFNMVPADAAKLKQRLAGPAGPDNDLLDPLRWPLDLDLRAINMHDGLFHLSDDQGIAPTIDSRFALTLEPDPDQDIPYPRLAGLTIADMTVTHAELTANITGSIELIRNLANPSLDINFESSGRLRLRGAVRDYLATPVCRLHLESRDFKPSVLAPLLMQSFYFDPEIIIDGDLAMDGVQIFNATLPHLDGNFALQNGAWQLTALKLTLPDEHGEIRGDMIFYGPEGNRKLTAAPGETGRVTFQFDGQSLPQNLMLDTLYTRIGLPGPPSTNELTVAAHLQSAQGTHIVSSLSVNGDNGALILEGRMDPFTTDMQMAGTFLVPLTLLQNNPQGFASPFSTHDDMAVYPVSITGTLTKPDTRFRTITAPLQNTLEKMPPVSAKEPGAGPD